MGAFRVLKFLFLVSLISFLIACAENVYQQASDADSDEALLVAAKEHLKTSSYDTAVATIGQMSTTGQATKEAQLVLVSAYSGQCGIQFDDMLSIIDNIGTQTMFHALMDGFPSATAAQSTACKNAETALLEILSNHGFTASDHMRMVFVAMGKIGTTLNRLATTSNTITAGFRACNPADIPDADANEIFTGLTLISVHIVSAGLSSFDSSEVTGVCSSLDALLGAGACDKTDSTLVSSQERCAARSIVNEGADLGLYDVAPGDGSNLCDEVNPDGPTVKNLGECNCSFSTWPAGC